MPKSKTDKIIEKPEKVESPSVATVPVPKGAVVVDDRVEFQLRSTIVRRNTREAFFIDRPLKPRRGFLVGQMSQSLIVGGRVYVVPEIDDSVKNDLESRFGKGRKEDELIVYGGEEVVEPEVEVRRDLKPRPDTEVVEAEVEEAEDTSS